MPTIVGHFLKHKELKDLEKRIERIGDEIISKIRADILTIKKELIRR